MRLHILARLINAWAWLTRSPKPFTMLKVMPGTHPEVFADESILVMTGDRRTVLILKDGTTRVMSETEALKWREART